MVCRFLPVTVSPVFVYVCKLSITWDKTLQKRAARNACCCEGFDPTPDSWDDLNRVSASMPFTDLFTTSCISKPIIRAFSGIRESDTRFLVVLTVFSWRRSECRVLAPNAKRPPWWAAPCLDQIRRWEYGTNEGT